jgi:hypothetical protein
MKPNAWAKLRFQNAPPPLKQHVADPCRLHHVRLHPASRLVDAPRDLLLRLHDLRMVQLAGITQALCEVIRPDAVKIDTRHRENGVQILQYATSSRCLYADLCRQALCGWCRLRVNLAQGEKAGTRSPPLIRSPRMSWVANFLSTPSAAERRGPKARVDKEFVYPATIEHQDR